MDQLLYGVVGRADDVGVEEQVVDVVAFVEVQGQGDHFLGVKCARGTLEWRLM